MRLMINFTIPLSAGNELVSSGKIGQNFNSLIEQFKPEASYFFAENGQRSGFMVIEMGDSSDLARVAESFWFGLQADISVTPVMNGEDLAKGLGDIDSVVKRYS